jgi:signal transduction histidine kinase
MLGSIFNLDLLTVGLAIAGTGLLGFTIYFNNKQSITNKTFLLMAIAVFFWSIFNYLSYQVKSPFAALWFLRGEIFFAVWHAFFNFQLFYVFPNEKIIFPKYYKFLLVPVVELTAFLNLTPLVFDHIVKYSPDGRLSEVANGPGIAVFGMIVLFLLLFAIYFLLKKTIKAQGIEKKQLRLMLIGAVTTLSLLLIFNFFLPAFFNNAQYISYGALFMFPFVLLSSYAIFRHHMFNIKVISTGILIFALAMGTLFEVVLSQDTVSLFLHFGVFLLVLGLGITLVYNVLREVRQREQLETLSRELGGANEKLKALDQARAEFITIASHQLRTPPATIKWYLSAAMAGDYGKLPPEVASVIEKAAITNNHLISLIEDMLNVSRIERGKMEFLFEPTKVEELASFAFEQLIPMAKIKKLDYTYTPPKKPLPEILADKEKLRQVMNNLIDNALKYTKLGTVAVSLFLKDNEIVFQVKDSGKGISPDEQNSIFQKYSRGKESIKQSAGLGLGLYVAKIIIDEHKGKVWAESNGEGQGSVFSFSLPVNSGLKQTTMVDLGAK